jgi:putative PIN family toxin of toxin-antitoxin system
MKADSGAWVVVDTNVLLSAALSPRGTPAQLVDGLLAGRRLVVSEATFAEFQTRIWKPKFNRYLPIERRKRLLYQLNAAANWVEVPEDIASRTYSRDPDDDKFIHAALAAPTPWLVTGDNDLLDLRGIALSLGLRILSPAEALLLPEFLGSGWIPAS